MKRLALFMAVIFLLAWALPAFAIPGLGAHDWKINIIGVPKDKNKGNAKFDNEDRGSIFIPLESGGDVPRQVKIYFVRGPEFAVLDGNATDDNEAKIQVPYSYTENICYKVFAIALGKPLKNLFVDVECAWDPSYPADTDCDDALYMGQFTVSRTKKTPTKDRVTEITGAFVVESVCFDTDSETAGFEECFEDIWIFNIPYLVDYFWDVDNNGLKLMQVRFYQTDECYPGNR